MKFEKFEKIQENKLFVTLNYVITLLSLYFLFSKIAGYEISLNFDFENSLAVISLICISSTIQAIAWSYMVSGTYDSIEIYSWLNSIIGKYFPFKIGIISKRIINKSKSLKSSTIFKNIIKENIVILLVLFFLSLYLIVDLLILIFIFLLVVMILKKIVNRKTFLASVYYFFGELVYILGLIVFLNFYIQNFILEIALIYMFSSILSIFITTAPAGFGVREYVFIATCTYFNYESDENLLLLVLSFRLLIILSDFLIYVCSFFFKARLKK